MKLLYYLLFANCFLGAIYGLLVPRHNLKCLIYPFKENMWLIISTPTVIFLFYYIVPEMGHIQTFFQQVNLMCTSIVTDTPVLRSYVVLCDLRMGMKCNGHKVCTTAISDACSVPNCCAQHFVIVIGLFLPESSVRAEASCSHLCP